MPLSINYNSSRELRAFLAGRGMGMRKKFGQNFLIDPNARSKLIEALGITAGSEVWEIGPGLGAMTQGLLSGGARVSAFEIDPAFSAALREIYGENPSFRLVEGDVFRTWPVEAGMRPGQAGAPCLLGNLPYNIAAALIADFIEKGMRFRRMVLTLQKEVARRMYAGPGDRDYSSFSVMCSSVYKITPLLTIKGSSFYPPPRVDSQGLRLDLIEPGEALPPLFYQLVRSLFSSRRKTVRNTLTAFIASAIMGAEAPGELASEALRQAGVSGDRRAETLGKAEFAALAGFLEGKRPNG